jgi:hypothetical protein
MAYSIFNNTLGLPAITETVLAADAKDKATALGLIVQATDPVLGSGEFIFLKGLAATAAGTWVTYNSSDNTTDLLAANAIAPVAIAMSANLAGYYGWYQISGKAAGKALTGFLDNANVYATATAGSVDDTVVAGDRVKLAKGASAVGTPSTGLAYFEIQRPFMDDGLAA